MSELHLPDRPPGVLPGQWIERALDAGVIHSQFTIPQGNVQPASLDLRLGETAYRLRCSFLPNGQPVSERLEDLAMEELRLIDGAILERNRPYLIPLMEELQLPKGMLAKANPKSSTGRLDVFTRVICDRGYQFDEIPREYSGKLYLEVVSRTFTVKVQRQMSLNQLRLTTGNALVADDELRAAHAKEPLLFRKDQPVSANDLNVRNGLVLSLDFRAQGERPLGYRAKKNSRLLDLSLVDHYHPPDYWEPVYEEPPGGVVLEPDEFYLLVSAEAVSIPPRYAAEMSAFDPTSGELRTHYAGFFDPGFGHGAVNGTRAALEVRAHDVAFLVEHGQYVCRLAFERMFEEPNLPYGGAIGSNYQGQELALSKHFRFDRH